MPIRGTGTTVFVRGGGDRSLGYRTPIAFFRYDIKIIKLEERDRFLSTSEAFFTDCHKNIPRLSTARF